MFREVIRLQNVLVALLLVVGMGETRAQDLDPRAYARVPVDVTFLVTGFSYSQGGVLTDPSVPIDDLKAKVETPSIGVGHTFGLFGLTANAFAVLPFSWAQASALVFGQPTTTTRSGLSDMRLRMAVLLLGAPAATAGEFARTPNQTIVGTSLSVIAPTGQFFPDKLINLGANRWAFKPEIALSQPFGPWWLVDLYAGVWFFTTNHSFYPGTATRTQQPLGSVQAHLSYNVQPMMWVSLNATFYAGGQSEINGLRKDDRQNNSRVGATLVFPVGTQHSVKIAASTGAIIRVGADFTSLSVAWQSSWF